MAEGSGAGDVDWRGRAGAHELNSARTCLETALVGPVTIDIQNAGTAVDRPAIGDGHVADTVHSPGLQVEGARYAEVVAVQIELVPRPEGNLSIRLNFVNATVGEGMTGNQQEQGCE